MEGAGRGDACEAVRGEEGIEVFDLPAALVELLEIHLDIGRRDVPQQARSAPLSAYGSAPWMSMVRRLNRSGARPRLRPGRSSSVMPATSIAWVST